MFLNALACIELIQKAEKNNNPRNETKLVHFYLYISLQTHSPLGLNKRFAYFPDTAVNLWVLVSGQHDAEH